MAKKQPDLSEIFKKTEPEQAQPAGEPKPKEKTPAIGVALTESEWARMAEIAAALGMTKHKLAAWALRDFLKRYDAGELPLQNRPSLPPR